MSALSAMKWTPQNTMYSAGGGAGKFQRVAGVVGESDDLVALVVVAENHETVAQRALRGGNALVHLVV